MSFRFFGKAGVWIATSLFAVLFLSRDSAVITPPMSANAQLAFNLKLLESDGARWLSGSQSSLCHGLQTMVLQGPPEWRGAIRARFLSTQMLQTKALFEKNTQGVQRQSNDFFEQLSFHLPEESRQELIGVTSAMMSQSEKREHSFSRWLACQTLPETVSHAWGFGICRSAGQPVILAQQVQAFGNISELDGLKVVTKVVPEHGLTYLTVGGAGLVGVIAGCNEAGIGILVIPGPASVPDPQGIPSSLLAREVMMQTCTLEDATRMLTTARVFEATTFLLGSGPEHRVVAIEKNAQTWGFRSTESGRLTAVGYFQSSTLAQDPASKQVQNDGPEATRLQRLQELLPTSLRPFLPEHAAMILRDQQGPGGVRLGRGHRAALDDARSIQSVIFDLTSKTIWVAVPPSPGGAFERFDWTSFPNPGEHPLPAISAETMEPSENDRHYAEALQAADRLLEQGKHQECLALLQEIRPRNPNDYQSYLISGKALLALKHWDEAAYDFNQARRRHPAFRSERAYLEQQLKKLQ